MKNKTIISLGTGTPQPYGLNRIFEIANKAGFKYLELMVREYGSNGYLDTLDVDYLRSLEQTFGMKIITVHIPYDFEYRPQNFQSFQKLITKLKPQYVISHIPYQKLCLEYEEIFKNYFLTNEIPSLIENLPITNEKQPTIDPKEWHDFSGFCYDTCHGLISGQDIISEIKSLPNIKQLHLSYFDGKEGHKSVIENKPLFEKVLKLGHFELIC
ncbi:MAG TPA: hypothetical protein PK263_03955, partial [bacterium]|nr:hypothetical protein [bacterium]